MTEVDLKPKPKRKIGKYEEPTPEKRAYGARLRHAREVAGMTLTEAAEAMKYSQPVQLSQMENGKRMPPHAILVQCAKLYGTTMDYLCGLADDSDRDPATAILRHVSSLMSANLQRLIGSMADASVDVARELLPSVADGQRLAGLVIEANTALTLFRQRNPKYDDMRGGAALASKLMLASEQATRYVSQVERGKRLMSARTMRESARAAAGADSQISLVPVLDLFSTA